jgi:hypothetical protein
MHEGTYRVLFVPNRFNSFQVNKFLWRVGTITRVPLRSPPYSDSHQIPANGNQNLRQASNSANLGYVLALYVNIEGNLSIKVGRNIRKFIKKGEHSIIENICTVHICTLYSIHTTIGRHAYTVLYKEHISTVWWRVCYPFFGVYRFYLIQSTADFLFLIFWGPKAVGKADFSKWRKKRS